MSGAGGRAVEGPDLAELYWFRGDARDEAGAGGSGVSLGAFRLLILDIS